jgi:hypothetical protein
MHRLTEGANRNPSRVTVNLSCTKDRGSGSLADMRPQLAGAPYTAHDESNDANLFTRELACLCVQIDVHFRRRHHITALRCAPRVLAAHAAQTL